MARFRATIEGQRGVAFRLGSINSGITANVNGWNDGIKVIARVAGADYDTFDIYGTGGSHRASNDVLLGTFQRGVFTPNDNGDR